MPPKNKKKRTEETHCTNCKPNRTEENKNKPWISNYPPLQEWLNKHEARCMWQVPNHRHDVRAREALTGSNAIWKRSGPRKR